MPATRFVTGWFVVIVLALIPVACSTPGGSGPSSGPGDGSEDSLAEGGTATSPDGVLVAAPPGSLSEAVTVTVAPLAAALADAHLPSSVRLRSPWYRLQASERVVAPSGTGFVLGLPVPEAASPDDLAVVVRVPAEENMYDEARAEAGSEEEPTEDVALGDDYAYLRGSYDADRDAFFVALYELPAEGDDFALVEGPSFGPVGVALGLAPTDGHPGFATPCHPEFDDDVEETCDANVKLDAIAALEDAYDDFTGLGFREPLMYREPTAVGYESDGTPIVRPGPWVMTLRACSRTGSTGGKYTGAANATSTWSCIKESGVTASVIDAIRHELFHAVQWAYPSVRSSSQYWVTESTATVAEKSLDTMQRDTGRPVRDIDVRLDGGGQKYATQDFWIYVGLRGGLGLDYLIAIFEEGANASATDTVLARDFAAYAGIGDAFWAWAKNQAFEKAHPLGGAGFADACALDTDDQGRHFALDITDDNPTGAPMTLQHTGEAPLADTQFVLAPLTARVVRIDAEPWAGGAYQVPFEVKGPPDLRAKVYLPDEEGTSDCVTRSDIPAHTLSVTDAPTYVHVLVANTSTSSARSVTLDVPDAGPPGVEIVEPAAGVAEEGEEAFLAVVGGFQGADPNHLTVRWYADLDGVPTLVGTSPSGEPTSLALCNGQYDVTAEATDPRTSASVSEEIPVTVTRSDDPPDACVPEIDIVRPKPVVEVTYASGRPIPLEAVVDADPPEYPVLWRRDAPDGAIIGTGLVSSTKLPSGNHTIYVEYGPASDSVFILVSDGTNALPTADITSPDGDLSVPLEDVLPSCSTTLTLEGEGSDAEDGVLTGDDLLWRYRTPTSGSIWYGLGTGPTAELYVQCGGSYTVQLQATDSANQRGTDEIAVTVEAPPN